MRITHKDGTVADHDFHYLLHDKGGMFAPFTEKTIADVQLVDGYTIGWIIEGETVDLAPDALWEHAVEGRCIGNCGWQPGDTVVVPS